MKFRINQFAQQNIKKTVPMKQIRITFLLLFLHFVQSQLDFILDTTNPLVLNSTIQYYKQLTNTSIIIHYTNSSFIMYQSNFKYLSNFTIQNKVFEYIQLTASQSVLKLIDQTMNNIYFYNIDRRQIIYNNSGMANVLFVEYIKVNLLGEFFAIVTLNKVSVFKKNNNVTMLVNVFDLEVYRKAGETFLKCGEYIENKNSTIRLFCGDFSREIIQIEYNCTANLFVSEISIVLSKKLVEAIYSKPLMLFQADDKHLSFYDCERRVFLTVDKSLQPQFILQFTQAQNSFYLVTATKVFKAVYTLTNSSIDLSKTVMSKLTFTAGMRLYLTYNTNTGMLDTGYQVGTTQLYSFNPCYNSSVYSSGTCSATTCNMTYCSMCSIQPNVCSNCSTNFTNYIYKCLPNQCNVLNCTQCLNSSFCLICNTNYTLQSNGLCLQNCFVQNCFDCLNPDFCYTCKMNYTLNSSTGLCMQICNVSNCFDCYNPVYCNICSVNYTLDYSTGQCIYNCNISNCISCSSYLNCTQCSVNYSINTTNAGMCIQICNVLNCSDCLNPDFCSTCQTNYSLQLNGSCKEICNVSHCIDCLNPDICSTCDVDYLLESSGQCTLICDVLNCSVCQNRTYCSVCNSSFHLLSDGTCQITCSDSNCLHCLNSSFCIACTDGYTLDIQKGFCFHQVIQFSSEYLQKQYHNLTQQLQSIGTVTKSANSIPSLRLVLVFLSPMFAFFDDYWYYIYHDNKYQYLNVSIIFLNFMYQMNKDRIFPDFIDTDQINSPLNFTNNQAVNRYQKYTNQRILLIDQQPTYFLKNSKQLLISQYLFITLFMLLLYSIYKLYECLIGQQQKIQKIQTYKNTHLKYKILFYLKKKASFRFFTILLLESNLIFLSFRTGSQLLCQHSFQFQNKINIIVGHVFLLAIILFSICFYCLFKKINISSSNVHKINGQINKCQYKTIFIGLKCLVFGLIHSLFIQQNQYQLFGLITAKICLICLISIKSQLFNFNSIKTFAISYYVCGILLDMMFYLTKIGKLKQFMSLPMISILEAGLVSVVIGSVVATVITQIIYEFRQLCKNDQKSKVYDDCNLDQHVIMQNLKTSVKKKVNFKVELIAKSIDPQQHKNTKFHVELINDNDTTNISQQQNTPTLHTVLKKKKNLKRISINGQDIKLHKFSNSIRKRIKQNQQKFCGPQEIQDDIQKPQNNKNIQIPLNHHEGNSKFLTHKIKRLNQTSHCPLYSTKTQNQRQEVVHDQRLQFMQNMNLDQDNVKLQFHSGKKSLKKLHTQKLDQPRDGSSNNLTTINIKLRKRKFLNNNTINQTPLIQRHLNSSQEYN